MAAACRACPAWGSSQKKRLKAASARAAGACGMRIALIGRLRTRSRNLAANGTPAGVREGGEPLRAMQARRGNQP